MTEHKPFKVHDPGVWLGSQLEHPAESAGLTTPADVDGESDAAGTSTTNRPSGGAAYLVIALLIVAIGVAAWVAGGGLR